MSLVCLCATVRYNIKYTYAALTIYRHNATQNTSEPTQTNENTGWSKESIAAGAQDVGYPSITHGMFARGGGDLVHYFQQTANQRLVQYMKAKVEDRSKNYSPGEFVEEAVKHRLEMVIPYISRWPQAIALMSLPPNVQNTLATQLTLVDDICYYAGDRSVDFSWYARRLALVAIYKATELYMVQDKSVDYLESWKFLNNRLTEAIQLQNVLLPTHTDNKFSTDTLLSTFITARNILGMNNR
ncbi:COQ9 [Popillia japonica]|uniref:Ubiquinone biosynthesis protein n=1 Tax=Popillia japonica TaxID=7064 RepID=A0AAW1J1P9_POPJA